MSFETLKLSGERVVVRGTDNFGTEGSTVLNSAEWNEIKVRLEGNTAEQEFESTVQAFFAPLTEAADKLAASRRGEDADPVTYVVLDEGEEGNPGRKRQVASLSKDSIVLRLLEQGDTNRLVWVNDTLEVLEVVPNTTTPVVTNGGTEPHEIGTDADPS